MTNYLRPSQIAKMYNVSRQYIYMLCKQGRLDCYLDEGKFFVDQESVIAFMKGRKHVTYVDVPSGIAMEIKTIIEKAEKAEDDIKYIKQRLSAISAALAGLSQQPQQQESFVPTQPSQSTSQPKAPKMREYDASADNIIDCARQVKRNNPADLVGINYCETKDGCRYYLDKRSYRMVYEDFVQESYRANIKEALTYAQNAQNSI